MVSKSFWRVAESLGVSIGMYLDSRVSAPMLNQYYKSSHIEIELQLFYSMELYTNTFNRKVWF